MLYYRATRVIITRRLLPLLRAHQQKIRRSHLAGRRHLRLRRVIPIVARAVRESVTYPRLRNVDVDTRTRIANRNLRRNVLPQPETHLRADRSILHLTLWALSVRIYRPHISDIGESMERMLMTPQMTILNRRIIMIHRRILQSQRSSLQRVLTALVVRLTIHLTHRVRSRAVMHLIRVITILLPLQQLRI